MITTILSGYFHFRVTWKLSLNIFKSFILVFILKIIAYLFLIGGIINSSIVRNTSYNFWWRVNCFTCYCPVSINIWAINSFTTRIAYYATWQLLTTSFIMIIRSIIGYKKGNCIFWRSFLLNPEIFLIRKITQFIIFWKTSFIWVASSESVAATKKGWAGWASSWIKA